MKMKRLFCLMALAALTTFNASADTEVGNNQTLDPAQGLEPLTAEEVAILEAMEATQEKATIELPAWVKNIKFSGYGMLQYQGEDKENAHTNTFNLRLARFILDGKIGDFDWRAQIQGTNATGPGQPTVQLVDLYAEWRK